MDDVSGQGESATTPKFHPDFNTSSPGDIILRSGDNVDFYFSGPLLIGLSTFFRDAASLPVTHTSVDGARIFEMPSSTSVGLHFILAVLSKSLRRAAPELPVFPGNLRNVLTAAIPTIAAYDLDVVFGLINSHYHLSVDKYPVAQYTLAVLAGDKELAASATKRSLRCRTFEIICVEQHLFSGLQRWRPDAALKLDRVHDNFLTALRAFKHDLCLENIDFCNCGLEACATRNTFKYDRLSFRDDIVARLREVCDRISLIPLADHLDLVADLCVECVYCGWGIKQTLKDEYERNFSQTETLCRE